jgi:hypothetical protein
MDVLCTHDSTVGVASGSPLPTGKHARKHARARGAANEGRSPVAWRAPTVRDKPEGRRARGECNTSRSAPGPPGVVMVAAPEAPRNSSRVTEAKAALK